MGNGLKKDKNINIFYISTKCFLPLSPFIYTNKQVLSYI